MPLGEYAYGIRHDSPPRQQWGVRASCGQIVLLCGNLGYGIVTGNFPIACLLPNNTSTAAAIEK